MNTSDLYLYPACVVTLFQARRHEDIALPDTVLMPALSIETMVTDGGKTRAAPLADAADRWWFLTSGLVCKAYNKQQVLAIERVTL